MPCLKIVKNERMSLRQTFVESFCDSALMSVFFVFIDSLSVFFKKRLTLRTDIVVTGGGKVKRTYSMYFPWPQFEAEVSISIFCFLFAHCL
jgi:hypothetical protein